MREEIIDRSIWGFLPNRDHAQHDMNIITPGAPTGSTFEPLVGFDHRVGHCAVLHMMAESMRASGVRCWATPVEAGRTGAMSHALYPFTQSRFAMMRKEVVWG